MENNTVKKDNRKAFPKYLLILFVSAIFSGVLGFAAGWIGRDNLSEVIAAAVTHGLTAAAPWALLVTSAVSLTAILWLYRSAKGQKAVMVIECDQSIPADGISWLEHVEGVLKVTYFSGS